MISRLAQATLGQTVAGNTTDALSFSTPAEGPVTGGLGNPGSLRVSGSIDTATTVSLRLNSVNGALDSGNNQIANAPFSFQIPAPAGQAYTIRFGAACTINWLVVDWCPV